MTGRCLIRNVRLLDPASGLDSPGGLLFGEGRILAVDPGLFAPADIPAGTGTIVDGEGLVLAPGLIDMHASLREPGNEHLETIRDAGRAAAAGGITTVVATPDTVPVADSPELVEFVLRRGSQAPVRILTMASATRGCEGRIPAEIGLLGEAGAIAFTDSPRTVDDAGVMLRLLQYAGGFDALVVQDPGAGSLAAGAMNEGGLATRLGLPGIPPEAEILRIVQDLVLVRRTRTRWHASHVSLAESVRLVRAAREEGLPVSCAVAPFSLAMNEYDVGDYRTFARVRPPLRQEQDRRAIAAAIGTGDIDVISSRHEPQDQESKRLPFEQASSGMIGLETMLPLALGLVHSGDASLMSVLAAMTARPAALLRLPQGRLAPGAPADLVLIDPDVSWRLDPECLLSRSRNTPLDDRILQGRAERTWCGGVLVHDRRGQDLPGGRPPADTSSLVRP